MRRSSWLSAALAAAALATATCAAPSTPPGDDPLVDDLPERHPLAGYRAYFVLTWNGARIGDATEELTETSGGLRFTRHERLTVRRGDAILHTVTEIAIDTDAALGAERVQLRQQTGDTVLRGRAVRGRDGDWRIDYGDEPPWILPRDHVPAELVPLLVATRADRRVSTPVMMPGRGFARGHMRVAPAAGAGRALVTAELDTRVGVLRARMTLTRAGTVLRLVASGALAAFRADEVELAAAFDPPELVDTVSIPLRASVPEFGTAEVVLGPVDRPPPPPLPGQRVVADGDRWRVTLGSNPATAPALDEDLASPAVAPPAPATAAIATRVTRGARDRDAAIAALARATERLLEDDLGATDTSPRAALAHGRGDCTSHAVLFASLASARGIPVALVTGFRIDGDRMVRHRWAIARGERGWLSVDPTYGEAPARPRLLGLAVHGAAPDELSLIDDVAFLGLLGAEATAP